MLHVFLNMPSGARHELTGTSSTSEVLAPIEALTSITGTTTRSDLASPSRSGSRPGSYRFEPIQAEIEFYLHAEDGEQMERVYKDFRKNWSLYGKGAPVVMEIYSDKSGGPYYYEMWLDTSLPGIPVDASTRTSMPTVVPVLIPAGLAHSWIYGDENFPDAIETTRGVVDNRLGSVPVYPVFRSTSGPINGLVTGPSGATGRLQADEGVEEISLDPMIGRAGVVSEAIPPGEVGDYIYDQSLTMAYKIQVDDPWSADPDVDGIPVQAPVTHPVEPGSGGDGITPHIGVNGNWFLGSVDTGVSASGPKGEKGDTGQLREEDVQYLDRRTEEAEAAAEASEASAGRSKASEEAAKVAADLAITTVATTSQYVGEGFPERKVTAPVGSIYTDRLATNGAVRWIKTSGTGTTGWKVEYGDTGWRDITDGLTGTVLALDTGAKVLIRRKLYDLEVLFVGPITLAASWGQIWETSQGFRPERESETALGENARLRLGRWNARIENADRDSVLIASGRSLFATLPSEVDWPVTLPGTPE